MAGVTDQELSVARVYSEAMLQLAEPLGEVDLLLHELEDFTAQVEKEGDLKRFLFDPTVDVNARERTFEKLFRGCYSDLLVNALQILNRKGRLNLIASVTEAYRRAKEALQGRIRVYVASAAPLSSGLRDQVVSAAAKQTGMEVDLIESVDESLIGGLVLRIGDRKLDASVAAKLKRLGQAFAERASHEIHGGRTYWEGAAV